MKVELETEEVKAVIEMIKGCTIPMAFAEKSIILLNKFKTAEKENDKTEKRIQPD